MKRRETLASHVQSKNCPTPSANDWKGSAKAGQRRGQLTDPEMGIIEASGQLNPNWVEWLMGWPIGWTSLEPIPGLCFQEWQKPGWFENEPVGVPRVAVKIPNRVSRLKAIGNGQVSQACELAWRTLAT